MSNKQRLTTALVGGACEADEFGRDSRISDVLGRMMNLPKPAPRQVVCPDTGVAYRDADVAVLVIRKRERRSLSADSILRAIRTGKQYAERFWDWRYPEGWDEDAMWARIALFVDANGREAIR